MSAAGEIRQVIEAADLAITAENFDELMTYYTDDAILVVEPGLNATGKEEIRDAFVRIAEYFEHSLAVTQGNIIVLEAGDTALVLMESIIESEGDDQLAKTEVREGTFVFRRSPNGRWLCAIDNSYGTRLLKGAK